jgi:hypothetical protein
MNFADRDIGNDPALRFGPGVALIAPVALFGTFMLADYPGPNSSLEYFGWWALCLAAAAGVAMLLRQFRKAGRLRFVSLAVSVAFLVLLYTLFYFDIRPDTPASVKADVENSLRLIGLASIGALVACIGWRGWKSRRA